MTRADPRVYPPAAFDIPLPGGEGLQLGFQSQQNGLRKAVRQMKGHMLRHVGTFKVGQISTAVPPGSAILLNGVLGVIDTANREIGVPGVVLRIAY